MLWSERLRKILIDRGKLSLEILQYSWNKDFKEKLEEFFVEDPQIMLFEIYNLGLNIGRCGLTSRYLLKMLDAPFNKIEMAVGTCVPLIGTESSSDGNHSWIEMSGFVYDPTLMVTFPVERKEEFGYTIKHYLADSSARIFSEYDVYQYAYNKLNYMGAAEKEKYYEDLLRVDLVD